MRNRQLARFDLIQADLLDELEAKHPLLCLMIAPTPENLAVSSARLLSQQFLKNPDSQLGTDVGLLLQIDFAVSVLNSQKFTGVLLQ